MAQVGDRVPGDEASLELREAQASLPMDSLARAGPAFDSLKSAWREANGQGVHFSGPGLRQQAALWEEQVAPWLEGRLRTAKE